MAQLFDIVGCYTPTGSTGTLTLGPPVTHNNSIYVGDLQTFAAGGVADGTVVSYLILDAGGAWEIGTGTYAAASNTLTRTLTRSSTGSLLNLSGNAQVYTVERAEDLIALQSSQLHGFEIDEGNNTALSLAAGTGQLMVGQGFFPQKMGGGFFGSGTATSATAVTANVGDTIIVCISASSIGAGHTITSLVDSTGANTYTKVIGIANQMGSEIWYCQSVTTALVAGTGTWTAVTSGGSGYAIVTFLVPGGGITADKTATASSAGARSATLTTAALTNGNAIAFAQIFFASFNIGGVVGWIEDHKFTDIHDYDPFDGVFVALGYTKGSTAALTWNPTWSNSLAFDAVLATFFRTATFLGDPAPLNLSGDLTIDKTGKATFYKVTTLDTDGSTLSTGVPGGNPLGFATSQLTVAAPTAPNSTTVFTMQGLAASFTPKSTTAALVLISAYCTATAVTVARGIIIQISFGTGAAPTSNSALAGTQVGNPTQFRIGTALTAAADLNAPIMLQSLITGLTVGTTYWVDLAAKAITAASVVGLNQVSVTVLEHP